MFAISKSKPPSLVTSYIGIATSRNQIRLYNVLHDTSIPEPKRKHIPSSGTYPKGFRVSGTHVGVKASNTKFPDLALISSDEPCNAAAVFTTNKFQAAPVQVSRTTLNDRKGKGVQSVVINSGCANAVTGKGGLEDAQSMGATVDKCAGLSEPSTIVMSTGVIGQRYEPLNSSLMVSIV
jgi:glutamate N-acetyltransferase/amino-acid N-acetyltransferase